MTSSRITSIYITWIEKKQTSNTKALARSFECQQIGLDQTTQEKKRHVIREKQNKKINGTASARNEGVEFIDAANTPIP